MNGKSLNGWASRVSGPYLYFIQRIKSPYRSLMLQTWSAHLALLVHGNAKHTRAHSLQILAFCRKVVVTLVLCISGYHSPHSAEALRLFFLAGSQEGQKMP